MPAAWLRSETFCSAGNEMAPRGYGLCAGKALDVIVPPDGFPCATVCNTRLGTACQRARAYLFAAFENFATAFRLKTAESDACLRRSLSDQPEMF